MKNLRKSKCFLTVVMTTLSLQCCQPTDNSLSAKIFETLENASAPTPKNGEAFYVLLTSDSDCKTCYESFKHLEKGTLAVGLFYSKTPALFKEFLENNTSGINRIALDSRDIISLAEQTCPVCLAF